MKRVYTPPYLSAHKVETSGMVCASAKGLSFSWNDDGESGEWADSRAWGGTLIGENEPSAEEYDDEW